MACLKYMFRTHHSGFTYAEENSHPPGFANQHPPCWKINTDVYEPYCICSDIVLDGLRHIKKAQEGDAASDMERLQTLLKRFLESARIGGDAYNAWARKLDAAFIILAGFHFSSPPLFLMLLWYT